MSVLKGLSKAGYNIWNVNINSKAPTWGAGWATEHSAEEYQARYDVNAKGSGIYVGKQANGEYVLMLDFDCCGETHILNGCEETVKRLVEFQTLLNGNVAGSFSASTKGNANWLVQYTDCPELIEKIARLGGKIEYASLEICLKWNCVLPPTMTKCKITGKFDNHRKWTDPSQPFLNLTVGDDAYNWIMNLIDGKLKPKTIPIKKQVTAIVVSESESDPEVIVDTEKVEDLLFNHIGSRFEKDGISRRKLRNGSVFEWLYTLKIAGCLKVIGNFETFAKWSKLGVKRVIKDPAIIWNSAKPVENAELAWRFLECILRDVDKNKYRTWRVYNHTDSFADLVVSKDDNGLATYIKDDITTLVYCNEQWIEYNESSHLWGFVKKPQATISTYLQTQIGYEIETYQMKINDETNDEKKEALKKKLKSLVDAKTGYGQNHKCSDILTFLAKYLKDCYFFEKLDINMYRMPFENGMLCLKTGEFRKGLLYSDFITKTANFDYVKASASDIAIVRKELFKICNCNPAHLDYYLSMFGYAMTGDSEIEQFIWAMKGETASNGKSVVFNALTSILPQFIKCLPSESFETNYKDRHKMIAEFAGLKLAWLNELRKGKSQDEAFVKLIAEGTPQEYKVMFGTMAKMPIGFKVCVVGNVAMKIDADKGIRRRYRQFEMKSSFKEEYLEDDEKTLQFKLDNKFGTTLKTTLKMALLEVIFEYSKHYWNEKKLRPYPDDWKAEGDKTMDANDAFMVWFNSHFELGGKIENFDFESLMTDIQKKEFKTDIDTLKTKFAYDRTKSGIHRKMWIDGTEKTVQKKGLWTGFQLKVEEIEDEDALTTDL